MKQSQRTKSISDKSRTALRLALLTIIVLLVISPLPVLAAPPVQSAIYTVEEGDTWESIAFRFGVPIQEVWEGNGVINPTLLAPGQRLFIPGATAREDSAGQLIELGPETSLLRIAAEADTMLVTLGAINQANWPYLTPTDTVYLPDAILHLPPPPAYLVEEQPAPQPTAVVVAPPLPEPEIGTELPALQRSTIGLQGHFLLPDQKALIERVAQNVGPGWLKQQVVWNLYEPKKNTYREEELAVLDGFVDSANSNGMRVLLSVTAAPDWTRPSTVNHGPPTNYQDLADFMAFLAGRYQGKVQAYEVWNEPNLLVEWTDFPISGTAYANMLSIVYPAIKAADPSATVLSAGLAPAADVTAPDGTVLAVDDRTFLRDMFAAGAGDYADAIGIHPYGAANPPNASYPDNRGAAQSHNDHASFFFWNNVNDYRIIQAEYGLDKPLWATEFGWPSSQGINVEVPPEFNYMIYLSEEDQARFIIGAFEMGQQWDFMGPMFLYILNFGPDRAKDDPQRAFTLIKNNGDPRLAYQWIRDAPKY